MQAFRQSFIEISKGHLPDWRLPLLCVFSTSLGFVGPAYSWAMKQPRATVDGGPSEHSTYQKHFDPKKAVLYNGPVTPELSSAV